MQYSPGRSVPAIPPRFAPPGRAALLRVLSLGGFLANRSNLAATLILVPIVALAVAAPLLPIADPLEPNIVAQFEPPSLAHPFGTDKLGREILSRTLAGLQVSLIVGFSAAAIALAVGLVVGTVAGFLGKTVDTIVSAFVDLLLAFPSLLLVIGAVAVFGAGIPQIIAAIAIADAPRAIRLQRALAMGLRSRTYMDAARLANGSTLWMLTRHVLPNTIAPMVVVASMYASNAILAEAALSFLGLGITPPQPSLGNLISDGRPYLQNAWWISTIPGLAIAVVSVSLHLFSDGIREQLDPRLRV
jgi:peptide/nickel transport system permease protein